MLAYYKNKFLDLDAGLRDALGIAISFLSLVILFSLLGFLPIFLPFVYLLMSAFTFFSYRKDKLAAKAQQWRTPESSLHTMAFLGGWPGALVAQQWLRHKTSKGKFRWIFWTTVGLNVFILLWLMSSRI